VNRGKTRAPRQLVSLPAQPTVGDWNAELPFGQLEFEFYFSRAFTGRGVLKIFHPAY
jgi:hypothetical protein